MFDSSYFIAWIEKLLDALDSHGIVNSIIVMDNAKYHNTLPVNIPKGSWRKMAMQEACSYYGIPNSPQELKSTLWGKLKEYIKQNIEPIICTMAANRGHEVIFSPPQHSDLQPIEIVWATTKGDVGCQNLTEATFRQVLT